MRPALALHLSLLALAATDFTILTFPFGGGRWEISFYQFAWKRGFGQPYISDYRLPTVLTYIAAFAAGIIGFYMVHRSGRRFVGGLGLGLSIVGAFSFLVEASHWVLPHHQSLIIVSPVVMFILAAIACLPSKRIETD